MRIGLVVLVKIRSPKTDDLGTAARRDLDAIPDAKFIEDSNERVDGVLAGTAGATEKVGVVDIPSQPH